MPLPRGTALADRQLGEHDDRRRLWRKRSDEDAVDLVLVSPERLANPEFGDKIMPIIGSRPGLIVIDEVHCISDWGHDFRPDYRRIVGLLDRLVGTVPVLGCTATANDRVVVDAATQLGAELTTFRGPLRRDGLALAVLELPHPSDRLAWLATNLRDPPGFWDHLLPHGRLTSSPS